MIHFVKYNIIGCVNTLLTLLLVYVLYEILHLNLELSNFLGFVLGAVNSYILNRRWNFKSTEPKRLEICRFISVFIMAYAVNFIVIEFTSKWLIGLQIETLLNAYVSTGYIAHVFANVAYVITSFLLLKYFVFKKR